MFQPSKQKQYQKVSLHSDSEDEEDVLYTATPLNDTSEDHRFGSGIYNRDLRLSLSSPGLLQARIEAKRKEKQNMIYAGLCFAALVVIVLGLALTVIVYARFYVPIANVELNRTDSTQAPMTTDEALSTEPSTEDPMCVSPPPPLPGMANGCQGKRPPSVPPTTTKTLSEVPTTHPSLTSQSSDETSQSSDGTSQSSDGISQSSDIPNQPTDKTGQSSDVTSPTSQSSDVSIQQSAETEIPTQATEQAASWSSGEPEERTEQPTESGSEPFEPTEATALSTGPENQPNELFSTDTSSKPEAQPPPVQDQDTTDSTEHYEGTTEHPKVTVPTLPTLTPSQGTVIWTKEFFPAATELSLQFFDINRDGVQDVFVAKVSDPCITNLLALDGLSGETVWQAKVNFDVFSLRCELDVNLDGITDCLASGRLGGFIALDGKDGSILWVVDSSITFPKYNFYFPLIVDDLDFDSIPDIINTHGGDADYPPWVSDRSPSFLVVISGRTGSRLMDPILIPDGHETYCSPVLVELEGTKLVLFGSGGETISGSLWAVSLQSIMLGVIKYKEKLAGYTVQTDDTFHPCFMNNDFIQTLRPSFNATMFNESAADSAEHASYLSRCPELAKHELIWNAYDLCMYEILHSPIKGVLLPPLILDLDADDVDDVLVSTFTGHVYALSGKDLDSRIWEAYYPDTESYSLPTPLFYSDDIIPDLLLRANLGAWSDYYNSSTLRVVDGHTGQTQWSLDTVHLVMNSGISIAADTHGQDAMLFFAVGEKGPERVRRHGNMQGPHDHIEALEEPADLWVSTPEDSFPDPDEDLVGFVEYCGHSLQEVSVHVYLVTREMVESGEELKPIAVELPFVFKGEADMSWPVNSNPPKRQTDQLFTPHSPFSGMNEFGEAPEDGVNTLPPDFDPQNMGDPDFNSQENAGNGPFSSDEKFNPQQNGFPPNGNFNPQQNGPSPPNSNFNPQMNPNNGAAPPDEDPNFDPTNKKNFRCARLVVPTNNVATPTIGDVNGDGKLELSYSVGWEVIPGGEQYIGMTPLKLVVRTFTIEEQFSKVYGEGGLDFSRFLPPDKQPWSKYMGRTGDNVYHPEHDLRDN